MLTSVRPRLPGRHEPLLDANRSPRITDMLRALGHDVVHVMDVGLVTASDRTIVEHPLADACIMVTADGDFPMQLALSGAARDRNAQSQPDPRARSTHRIAHVTSNARQATALGTAFRPRLRPARRPARRSTSARV